MLHKRCITETTCGYPRPATVVTGRVHSGSAGIETLKCVVSRRQLIDQDPLLRMLCPTYLTLLESALFCDIRGGERGTNIPQIKSPGFLTSDPLQQCISELRIHPSRVRESHSSRDYNASQGLRLSQSDAGYARAALLMACITLEFNDVDEAESFEKNQIERAWGRVHDNEHCQSSLSSRICISWLVRSAMYAVRVACRNLETLLGMHRHRTRTVYVASGTIVIPKGIYNAVHRLPELKKLGMLTFRIRHREQ